MFVRLSSSLAYSIALIAVQGPEAMKAVQGLTNVSFDKFYFMQTMTTELVGVADCRITRCGYTGMSLLISLKIFYYFFLHL